jgi:type IV pilus biogenesis protein CpaD/CtpE
MMAVAGALLLGCGKKDEAPPSTAPAAPAAAAPTAPVEAPKDREIKITAIKPEGDTLKVGETVKLTITAAYTVPAQGGNVGIVVQDAKNALVVNKLTQVAGGSGNVSEVVEFKVPATERIVVNVPLYLKDETKSATVATHEFTVKK